MRGDPPQIPRQLAFSVESTPHARGSTPARLNEHIRHSVYPACAGIHLHRHAVLYEIPCLPRMRGDPP